jgi:hypothetical protein
VNASRDPWAEFHAPVYAVRGLAQETVVSLDGRPGTRAWDALESNVPEERDRANIFEAFARGAETVRLLPCR